MKMTSEERFDENDGNKDEDGGAPAALRQSLLPPDISGSQRHYLGGALTNITNMSEYYHHYLGGTLANISEYYRHYIGVAPTNITNISEYYCHWSVSSSPSIANLLP